MPVTYMPSQTKYTEPAVSGTRNLIPLFGLTTIANSVARQDPVTGAKRKLRKSYKGHLADLPGRNEIPTEHLILRLIHQSEDGSKAVRPIDHGLLENVFTMEKTAETGVPGFDATLLGILPVAIATKKEKGNGQAMAESSAGEDRIRRRKRRGFNEGSDGVSTDGGEGRKKKKRS
ncbi:Rox3 mediator complex subunit-domain-containing protein [Lipomyces arxii]|uniref:Rox3 mediator complex subunit-domain-containing protein n=1 Tax=Lipomyces arxii TaxID=56418 RepID=UPI0034CF3F23